LSTPFGPRFCPGVCFFACRHTRALRSLVAPRETRRQLAGDLQSGESANTFIRFDPDCMLSDSLTPPGGSFHHLRALRAHFPFMFFPPLRFLGLISLALVAGSSARGADFEGSFPSTDEMINARERDRTRFYAEASYEKAIVASLQGYARAVELGSTEHQMLFLRHLTYDNWMIGNTENALDHGLRLLRLADNVGSVANRSRANRYLSQIYQTVNDQVRAKKYARAALADAELADQPNLRAFARESIGLCAIDAGDFATARRELTAALVHWQATGGTTTAFVVRRELGDLAIAEGDLPGALSIYEEVFNLSAAGGNPLSIARVLNRIATLLRRMSRPAEALARLERARPLVTKVGGHPLRLEFFTELALTHEALGEFGPAFAAQRTATEARNALDGAQARVQAAEAESRQDLEFKQTAIDRLNVEKTTQAAELRADEAELHRTADVRTAIGVGALVAVAALGAMLASQRARLRAERRALEETRRAQMVAEDAGVLKSRLLAIASHDLKGPLRSMQRSADTIEQKSADPAAVTSAVLLLRGHARQMSDLVRDLLDLAAIEGGDLQLHKSPVDLGRLTTEVVSRHAARAKEKLQTLSFAPPTVSLPFVGDPARLAQAIDKLIDNAVKYTPPSGTIRVTAERRGSHFSVAVADEGPGLGAEEIGRMFQPFQRLSAQPTDGEASTGLGLHITRDFIARHGGSVEVDSEPGRGTTFTVTLPVGTD
jgi:signal transduction histidine kinase